MGGAFGALVGLGFELLDLKTGPRQAGEEQRLGLGGPESNTTAGAERSTDHGEAFASVNARIFCLNEGGGTVIHI